MSGGRREREVASGGHGFKQVGLGSMINGLMGHTDKQWLVHYTVSGQKMGGAISRAGEPIEGQEWYVVSMHTRRGGCKAPRNLMQSNMCAGSRMANGQAPLCCVFGLV